MRILALSKSKQMERSPTRAALALAIEVRNKAEVEKAEAASALDAFDAALSDTRHAWFLAGDAVEEAKTALHSRLSSAAGSDDMMNRNAAIDGLQPPRQHLARTEITLTESKALLDLGNEGRVPVQARLLAAEHELAIYERKVREAVAEVEREPLADLLAAARNIQAQAHAARSIIRHLSLSLDGVVGNWNGVREGLAPEVRSFLNSGVGDNDSAAIAPWEAARARAGARSRCALTDRSKSVSLQISAAGPSASLPVRYIGSEEPVLLCLVSTGAQLTFNVEVTEDDPTTGAATWFPFNVTGASASIELPITVRIAGIRVNVTRLFKRHAHNRIGTVNDAEHRQHHP